MKQRVNSSFIPERSNYRRYSEQKIAIAMIISMIFSAGLLVSNAWARSAIYVNGSPLSSQSSIALQQHYGHIPSGHYWYDTVSGLWGKKGEPASGQIHAGLSLGGSLRPGASHGNTGVFINGRELPVQEVLFLQQVIGSPVAPGRYWLDAWGNAGYEGGPPLVNLHALSGQGSGGGNWTYDSETGGHVGGDGEDFYYYIDRDTSWTN